MIFYITPVFDGLNATSGSFEAGFLVIAEQRRDQYLVHLQIIVFEGAYEKGADDALSEFIMMQPQKRRAGRCQRGD
jgi:hypothetical protein